MKEQSWNFIKIFLDAWFIEYLIVFVMLRDLLLNFMQSVFWQNVIKKMKMKNEFFTGKRNWYQFFTCKRNWYQFFTCKGNWYQFFTHVRVIGTNSSHPQKHRSQVWRILTNSLHVRNYQRILHMCEELVPILHMCEELVPILHTREKVAPVLHMYDEYLPILHTSEIINMRNWPNVNFTFDKCDVLVPILLMGVKFTKWEIYGSTELSHLRTCI